MSITRSREETGEIVDVIHSMYRALGDRVTFDRNLHPEVSIWESDVPEGLIGLGELDGLRDGRARDASGEPAPKVWVEKPLVDRWTDAVAVARYELHAEVGDEKSVFRVTDVLFQQDSQWRIIHHHSEHLVG